MPDDVVDDGGIKGPPAREPFQRASSGEEPKQAPAPEQVRAQDLRRLELRPPVRAPMGLGSDVPAQQEPVPEKPNTDRVEGRTAEELMGRMVVARAFHRAARERGDDALER